MSMRILIPMLFLAPLTFSATMADHERNFPADPLTWYCASISNCVSDSTPTPLTAAVLESMHPQCRAWEYEVHSVQYTYVTDEPAERVLREPFDYTRH